MCEPTDSECYPLDSTELILLYILFPLHLIGFSLNIGALYVMLQKKHRSELRTDSIQRALFVTSLNEAVTSSVGLIFSIPAIVSSTNYIPVRLCTFSGFMITCCVGASMTNLAILASSRWSLVVLGNQNSRFQKYFSLFCISLFLTAILIVWIPSPEPFTMLPTKVVCWPNWVTVKEVAITILSFVLFSFLVLIAAYASIAVKICRTISNVKHYFQSPRSLSLDDTRDKGNPQKDIFLDELQMARRYMFIMLMGLCGWVFLPVGMVLTLTTGEPGPPILMRIGHFMVVATTILEPIFIVRYKESWRNYVASMFLRSR